MSYHWSLRQLLAPPRNREDTHGVAAAAIAAVEFVSLGGLELAAECATAPAASVRRRAVDVLAALLLRGCGDIGSCEYLRFNDFACACNSLR